jgi:hypothetical protein
MKGLKTKVAVMSGMAALALVGSAFAVWQFGPAHAGDNHNYGYEIAKYVDLGTATIAAKVGDATATNVIILDQTGTREGETLRGAHFIDGLHLDMTHVVDGILGDDSAATYTYKVELTLDANLAKAVKFDAAGTITGSPAITAIKTELLDNDTVASYTWTSASTAPAPQNIAYANLPTLAYISEPSSIAEYNTMKANVMGETFEQLNIKLTITANVFEDVND